MEILDLSPYWVCPPNTGGSIRIYNLNKEISKAFKVTQVSFRPRISSDYIFKSRSIKINDNYFEHQYSNKTILFTSFLLYKLQLPYDVLQSKILNTIKFLLDDKILNGDIIQVEHPWLFDFAYNYFKNKPFVLVAHNVEYLLIKDLISKKVPFFKKLLPKFKEIELKAAIESDLIFTVSEADLRFFKEVFKIEKKKMHVIPNGVDCNKYSLISPTRKKLFKRKLGLPLKKIILFIGSDHYPNREAIRFIRKFAEYNKDLLFLVVGEVSRNLKSDDNLIFTGPVKDVISYLKASDIAINPILSGSGTNLKMLEYLASGLPTITTEIGNRGLNLKHKKEVIITEIDQFPEYINQLATDKELYENLSYNGREKVEKEYDWKIISQKALKYYNKLL